MGLFSRGKKPSRSISSTLRMVLYIEENNNNVEIVSSAPSALQNNHLSDIISGMSPGEWNSTGSWWCDPSLSGSARGEGTAPQPRVRSGGTRFSQLLTVCSCLVLPVSPHADRRDFLFSFVFIQNLHLGSLLLLYQSQLTEMLGEEEKTGLD